MKPIGQETLVKTMPLPEQWRNRPVSLIDALLHIRAEHSRGRPLGFFFRGIETTDAVAVFETGYQACCRYNGIEDSRYEAFKDWLRHTKKQTSSEGWHKTYLAECGGDHLKAIQKHLDLVAEFAAQETPPSTTAGS
jgi:hypothetical protein